MRKPGLVERKSRHYRQGRFVCKHPEKYIGDTNNIIYRSQLEYNFFRYLDNNTNVIKWCSESVVIPYFDKTTNKKRQYFIDAYLEYYDKNNNLTKALVEIKPSKQILPPNPRGKNSKKRSLDYIKNTCKWQAARIYAKHNNMNFMILTEKELM